MSASLLHSTLPPGPVGLSPYFVTTWMSAARAAVTPGSSSSVGASVAPANDAPSSPAAAAAVEPRPRFRRLPGEPVAAARVGL